MIKYLLEQERILQESLRTDQDLSRTYEYAKIQIAWLSHERLVHLLVTLFVGFIMVVSVIGALLMQNTLLGGISVLLMILFLFYIFHYFRLENGVQRLYKLSNQIYDKNRLLTNEPTH